MRSYDAMPFLVVWKTFQGLNKKNNSQEKNVKVQNKFHRKNPVPQKGKSRSKKIQQKKKPAKQNHAQGLSWCQLVVCEQPVFRSLLCVFASDL